MTDKIGFTVTQPQGGISNPNIISWQYKEGWYPYSTSRIPNILNTLLYRQFPMTHSRVVKGFRTTCYIDDFYYRIHVIPKQVDLGNVVSSQEFKFYVWNAHLKQKKLTNTEGASDGIILEGKQAPCEFNPLEEATYKVLVSPNGASTIHDNIIFNFINELPRLFITGNRVVAFSFLPDWNEGIKERLEWSTDILQSESGVEQRSALYSAPRRFWQANFILHNRERQLFNNTSSWSSKVWAIPLWPDIQYLQQDINIGDTTIYCETKQREFIIGGLFFLWKNTFTYEIGEIVSISDNYITIKRPILNVWSKGTRLYPARSAQFNQIPEIINKTDSLQTTHVEFRLTELSENSSLTFKTKYLSYPVLDLSPDISQDLTTQYQKILLTLDNGQALPRVTDSSGYSFLCQGFRWLGLGRKDRAIYRKLLYYLNGKQKAIWIPSYSNDLTVVDIISPTELAINIAYCGFTNFANHDPDKQHIVIQLKDGHNFYRKITNSIVKNNDEELLAIATPMGIQIRPEEIARVSFMRLCRSDNDTVEINHETDSEGVANSKLVFRRVRDNEF